MTSKEKAKELVDTFRSEMLNGIILTCDFNPERERRHTDKAKRLALIAVNEIEKSLTECGENLDEIKRMKYEFKWIDLVRKEIENYES